MDHGQTITVVNRSPTIGNMIELELFQSQTPQSYFGQRVLYYQGIATVAIPKQSILDNKTVFEQVRELVVKEDNSSDEVVVGDAEVWVMSDELVLFFRNSGSGFSIQYPLIALHAKGVRQSEPIGEIVCLQLNLYDSHAANSDEDVRTAEFQLLPNDTIYPRDEALSSNGVNGPQSPSSAAQILYDALSACQDLHPDPSSQASGDAESNLDTSPGAGGWITAENAADFLDVDGGFTIPDQELRPGTCHMHSHAGNVQDEYDSSMEVANGGEKTIVSDGAGGDNKRRKTRQ